MSSLIFAAGLRPEPGVLRAAPQEVSWYAAYTRSNFERRAAQEISSKGIESYVPVFRQMHRWKDRYKVVETPMFRGYVFVRMPDSHETLMQVLRTAGVTRILATAGKIDRIPDEEIESVQRLAGLEAGCSAHPFLREGTRVRVKRGPLADTKGFLMRVKNKARLVISIQLLSQSVATEVDLCDIEVLRQEGN